MLRGSQKPSLRELLDRHLINGLRILWILVVLWCELGVFFWSVGGCRWPDEAFGTTDLLDAAPTHVLIIADPQILDHRSYPERPPWLTALTQRIVDLNLRKSWRITLRHTDPHAVVFLGDMMDGGRFAMSDEEYESYYTRFKRIFRSAPDLPVYYLPGNHDTGLGISASFSGQAHDRYVSHFGPLNRRVSIGNHTVVLIDAPSLAEEDHELSGKGLIYADWNPRKGGPVEFIKSFASEVHDTPVVLFTHIPLARPDTASCGPLREHGTIYRGFGFGYQNTLGKQTSEFVMESLKPTVIFSGDDHDYCEYIHSSPVGQVREVTVKSFSMVMGIRKPGFQLMSLWDPEQWQTSSQPTHADVPCLLPDQLEIYLSVYIPLLVLSLAALLLFHLYLRNTHSQSVTSGWPSSPPHSPLPDTDSDDGVWISSSPGRMPPRMRARLELADDASSDSQYDFLEDADGAPPRFLPPPGSARNSPRRSILANRILRWARIVASFLGSLLLRRRSAHLRQRRRSFWHGMAGDLVDVAAPPLCTFALITWWMFSDLS